MEKQNFSNAWETPREEVSSKGFATRLYKDWDKFGTQLHDVFHNGSATGKRHIVYKDQFVNTCSKQYVLLPNEEVVEVVEKIMKEHPEYGLVPDKSVSVGNWNTQNGNMISSKKTSKFPEGTTMFTKYVLDEEFDPADDGRKIKMGVSIGNSIDLTRGFSIMPYHFRGYCTNSMFHVATQQVLGDGNAELVGNVDAYNKISKIARSNVTQGEDYLKEVGSHGRKIMKNVRHTKMLTEAFINEQIIKTVDSLEVLKERYKEMNNVKMTQFHAQRIADSMPVTSFKAFDFMDVKERKDAQGNITWEAQLIKEDTTQWEGFNQMTDYLSHGSLGFNSTMNHYKEVDRIFAR
jgi:hypothetical protein